MYQTLAIAIATSLLAVVSLLWNDDAPAPPIDESFTREGIEEQRGNEPYGKYPPCYDICGATRTIFDRLEELGLLEAHALLLDLYSMVLCQEKHLMVAGKTCADTMLSQRIAQLRKMGANERDPKALSMVRRYLSPDQEGKDSMRFLVLVTNLLEREFARLGRSGVLTESQMASLRRLHTTFYMVHFDKIVCGSPK